MTTLTKSSQVSPRQAKEELARRRLQRDFTLYKYQIFRRYEHAAHLQAFDNALMQVARFVETGGQEGIGFLISEMPPRHGKTFTLSRFFPTWFLGRNPDRRVMNVGYGATLAEKSSRLARNLMLSSWYQAIFPGVQLDPQSKAVDAWNILEREGGMDALGVLGGATGKGAHILNCDDLIKNREEAESQVIRDKTWDGFNDDLMSRLEPGGAVILNGTRWHIDDPIGRALQHFKQIYGDKMLHLRFPAIAEADDPLGRLPGEALWPARYPIETLRLIESRYETTGNRYSWLSLYQQSPTAHEGGLFKRAWFEDRVTTPPEITRAVRFWDLAMSDRDSADFTAGVKIGQGIDGHYYVLDVAHKRVDWGDLPNYMANIMLADGENVIQGIEEAGYMTRAVTDLNQDPRLHGYSIFGFPVDKKKYTRALPYAAKCAAGLVHLVGGHWADSYVEELCLFTGNEKDLHDDQVDASSGAWSMIGESAFGGDLNYATNETFSGSEY